MKSSKIEDKKDVFSIKQIFLYISSSIQFGLLIGFGFAQYNLNRYKDIGKGINGLNDVYGEYSEVHNALDKDLPLRMHDSIQKLKKQPFHSACHHKTEKSIL